MKVEFRTKKSRMNFQDDDDLFYSVPSVYYYYVKLKDEVLNSNGNIDLKIHKNTTEHYEEFDIKGFAYSFYKHNLDIDLLLLSRYKLKRVDKNEIVVQDLQDPKKKNEVFTIDDLKNKGLGINFALWTKNFISNLSFSPKPLMFLSVQKDLFLICSFFTIEKYGYVKVDYKYTLGELIENLKNYLQRVNCEDLDACFEKINQLSRYTIYKILFLYHKIQDEDFRKKIDLSFYEDLVLNNFMRDYLYRKDKEFFKKVRKTLEEYDRIYIGDFPLILAAINSFVEEFKYDDLLNKNKKEMISLQKAYLKSNFIGNVGDRIKIKNCKVFKVVQIPKYTCNIVKVYDEKYNVYSFYYDKFTKFEIFETIPQISGKIKHHKEYNGIKENWIHYIRFTGKPKNNKEGEKKNKEKDREPS